MAISKIKSDSIDTIAATKLTGTITPSADAVTDWASTATEQRQTRVEPWQEQRD